MLAKVIAGLFVLWIIGFTAGISGAVIHLLLVLIGLLLLGKLLEPKRLH